jgi:photosystem II stability/assembly factor-like uncharacterized protein
MKKVIQVVATILIVCSNISYSQWEQTSCPYYGRAIWSLATSGSKIFAGTDIQGQPTTVQGGVCYSYDNGANWTVANTGLTKVYIQALAIKDSNIFIGHDHGISLSTNFGVDWKDVTPKQFSALSTTNSIAIFGSDIYAGIDFDGVVLSTNNGTSWVSVNNGLTRENEFGTWFQGINSFTKSGSNIFGIGFYGVFITKNNGNTWSTINSGLPNFVAGNCIVANGNYIFIGTRIDSFLYYSTDNGTSWNARNDGMKQYAVNSIIVNGSIMYAGTDSGIYLSRNNGINWSNISSDLPYVCIKSLAINDLYLFVGTNDGGVWRRSLQDILTSVADSKSIPPSSFMLEQNYPNPFNPTTTIEYSIPKQSHITIKVYDLLGREITTLVNEEKSPGSYEVKFNGSSFTSGVYLFRMQAGSFSQTKKFMLLK